MNESKLNHRAETDPLTAEERARSDFVRNIVQGRELALSNSNNLLNPTPKRLVQFWDNLQQLPEDVRGCMESWQELESQGLR